MTPHVVIVGAGFGGLYAARRLGRSNITTTVVDKRNFHLFQPLLYQVATGGLSPGDIASPIRAVLRAYPRTRVVQGELIDIDPGNKQVILSDGKLDYDSLVVATGMKNFYFGNDDWPRHAPPLKTIEEALYMRRRIFAAFEKAERESDPARREALMTFVVIGGGPTGVELAGALAELSHFTLRRDFRRIDTRSAHIHLVEAADRILPAYPPGLSHAAQRALQKLGVTVNTRTRVRAIGDESVAVACDGGTEEQIATATALWAAGVEASPMGKVMAQRFGVELDSVGRVRVEPDLSLPGAPDVFVIGDLAHFPHQTGSPLPGVAPVAMQQGRYVAELIAERAGGRSPSPFRYHNKGNLAVIGRHRAVADFGRWRFSGYLAWWIWIFVHIGYLIEFGNKVVVMAQWAWNYLTRKQGARLITEDREEER